MGSAWAIVDDARPDWSPPQPLLLPARGAARFSTATLLNHWHMTTTHCVIVIVIPGEIWSGGIALAVGDRCAHSPSISVVAQALAERPGTVAVTPHTGRGADRIATADSGDDPVVVAGNVVEQDGIVGATDGLVPVEMGAQGRQRDD